MKAARNTFKWMLAITSPVIATPDLLAQDKKTHRHSVEGHAKAADARTQKDHLTKAVNNLRQIGLALFEFENAYGSFPDESTAAAVSEHNGNAADAGAGDANEWFNQLIAAGIVLTDRVFTLEAPAKHADPDRQAPARTAKCVFSYFSGMQAAGSPRRPLVVAPLIKGETTFDPAVFGGKAIILCLDNSVHSVPIDKHGRVMIDGKDIFDPTQPFWNGKVPPIRWPDN